MERIKIGNTDIFLEDYGENRGKIIISDTEGYNFSYYWGSMGDNLKEFLLRINEDYFVDKLCVNRRGDFSGKQTVKAIRRAMKEDYGIWDIPWYKHMEAQKELREKLRDLEGCDEVNSFYYECGNIADNYWGLHYKGYNSLDEKEFEQSVQSLLMEPHHYFEYEPSNEHRFLKDIFGKLQKQLNTELVTA